jgi:hypothetical protein
MAWLDKVKFKFWDDVEAVTSLLERWKPRKCKKEKDFENSLYKFLNENLGDVQITKQYAQGRVKADLVVGKSVIVELKTDLNTTVKYQRLIGQLTQYSEWEGRIVVLLTGDTDVNLRKDLDRFIAEQNKMGYGFGRTITVFQK